MATHPNIPLWLNEGIQLQQAGKLPEAENRYRLVLQHDPDNAHALHVLGVCYYQQQKFAEAIPCLQRVVTMQPGFFPAFNNLGIALKASGQLAEAIVAFRTALQLQPQYAEAAFNLGIALEASGDPVQALNSYRQVLQLKPDFAAAHTNAGNLLRKSGAYENALQHLQAALQLTPRDGGAHYDVALALMDMGRYADAINAAKTATSLNANHYQYWEALGSAQRLAGFTEPAIASLQRAVALSTSSAESAELQFELGVAQIANGEMADGKATLNQVALLKPDWLKVIFERDLALPPLYDSDEDVAHWREQWSQGLSKIEQIIQSQETTKPNNDAAFEAVSAYAPFFLHYQNCDNTDLQKRFGKVVETITARAFPQFTETISPHKHGGRLRVGFVSSYFRTHSVALFFSSWVSDLDPKQFEVFAWNTGDIADTVTQQIQSRVEHFQRAPGDNTKLLNDIRAANLDVLIYLDVGMDPRQQVLASLRLAPIQCSAYGHPVTTGLANIDYYLGADGAEPENAQNHYSEKLIRLPGLAVNYPFPNLAGKKIPALLQKKFNGPLLLCVQRMFKILPEFDRIAARIARELPGCRLAFYKTMSNHANRQFTQRISAALRAEGVNPETTLLMLPTLPYPEFLGAAERADLVLDTTFFSGGNSSFDVLAVNTPIVTYLAPMMRGRQTAAMLNLLGVPGLIAKTHDEYVQIALELARNAERRKQLRHTIGRNSSRLFNDTNAVPALANALLKLTIEK